MSGRLGRWLGSRRWRLIVVISILDILAFLLPGTTGKRGMIMSKFGLIELSETIDLWMIWEHRW